MKNSFQIQGNIVDIASKKIFFGEVFVSGDKIEKINYLGQENLSKPYILPGFIDAHIHIESSMLTPCQFARLAVVHGTVATVSDPHEIANVLGVKGVEYMIENAKKVNFKFNFGCPSCVPATIFETAGSQIDSSDVAFLMQKPEIKYLAEMMNFPGVLNGDPEVLKKIAIAKKYNKPVDGHAPGLKGELAQKYASAGISTDHECFTAEEAYDKLKAGMKIIIREGSAACNFKALVEIISENYEKVMFCSDDKHPDSLVESHINELVKRSLSYGIDLFKVLQIACSNPISHYGLEVGLLKEGDYADFIIIDNFEKLTVLKTYINGELVAENGKTAIASIKSEIVNQFKVSLKQPEDFSFSIKNDYINVIEALDGQLITNNIKIKAKTHDGKAIADPENDILKITVVNRYKEAKVAVAFIKNFGLTNGAIASSVAHDSHNIIAVGVDDESICKAVNLIMESQGGVSLVNKTKQDILPLPIAGIMTGEDGYEVAKKYSEMDASAKQMGSKLNAPFMTLSFMGLLVIPSLKISDLGLFDGEKFEFV